MSKRYNIRWKQSDNEDLRKAVKNFNAKISRLEKKNPKMKNALPERVTVKGMKELIQTRSDLKREINALRRFSQKGAEELVELPDTNYNITVTKWQKNEAARRIGIINRKRKQKMQQIEDLEATSRGIGLGYKKGDIGMGDVDKVALKPMKMTYPTMERRDFKKRFKAILKESQSKFWEQKELETKENILKGIKANYNIPELRSEVEELRTAIEGMDFKEFYERFKSEEGVNEIISPPPGSDMTEQLTRNFEVLKSVWVPKAKPK